MKARASLMSILFLVGGLLFAPAAHAAAGNGCDVDGDGKGDLVIGVPGEDLGSIQDAGLLTVVPGTTVGPDAAGAEIWHADRSGVPGAVTALETFGQVIACGDFDGDGHDDVATGSPGDKIDGVSFAGSVTTLYGSSSGLTASGAQRWDATSDGLGHGAAANEFYGSALAVGDFDGDGYDDLAIGIPGRDIGGAVDAGAVVVLYGSASGLVAAAGQEWHQDVTGIKGVAETGDAFGHMLAAGDFDGDGPDDLAIGVGFEDTAGVTDAGAVAVLPGSPAGLTANRDLLISAETAGIPGVSETSDLFGASLTTGDFDGDGRDDLAVGVPFEDLGSLIDAGAVVVVPGAATGLDPSAASAWHQNTASIKGAAEAFDRFGESLAAGDIDGDGADDLAIGAPGEALGSIAAAGMVHVIFGGTGGLDAAGNLVIHQNTAAVPGVAEADDEFGVQVGVLDIDGDGWSDLVVGVPLEDLGSVADAGAVQTFLSPSGTLTPSTGKSWTQSTTGIAGSPEAGDQFGSLGNVAFTPATS